MIKHPKGKKPEHQYIEQYTLEVWYILLHGQTLSNIDKFYRSIIIISIDTAN